MSEQKFFVVGGEYADTTFTEPSAGTQLERRGPFGEREAKNVWRDLTGKTVDNALVRYFLTAAEEENQKVHWVVGGEYADTTFTKLATGKELEVYGPFVKGEALGFWRAVTSRSVDDAMVRYDIRKNFNSNNGPQPAAKTGGPVTRTIEIKLSGGRAASVQLTRPEPLTATDVSVLLSELEGALSKLKATLAR